MQNAPGTPIEAVKDIDKEVKRRGVRRAVLVSDPGVTRLGITGQELTQWSLEPEGARSLRHRRLHHDHLRRG